jgi:hypothetical protein
VFWILCGGAGCATVRGGGVGSGAVCGQHTREASGRVDGREIEAACLRLVIDDAAAIRLEVHLDVCISCSEHHQAKAALLDRLSSGSGSNRSSTACGAAGVTAGRTRLTPALAVLPWIHDLPHVHLVRPQPLAQPLQRPAQRRAGLQLGAAADEERGGGAVRDVRSKSGRRDVIDARNGHDLHRAALILCAAGAT